MIDDDPYEAVLALPELKKRTFQTPGAGKTSKPFRVASASAQELVVRTARGGRVTLRPEPFPTALKLLGDLGVEDAEGWVRTSDETLVGVLQGENRDKACSSYVLPLLEAVGLLEIARVRPSKARIPRPAEA